MMKSFAGVKQKTSCQHASSDCNITSSCSKYHNGYMAHNVEESGQEPFILRNIRYAHVSDMPGQHNCERRWYLKITQMLFIRRYDRSRPEWIDWMSGSESYSVGTVKAVSRDAWHTENIRTHNSKNYTFWRQRRDSLGNFAPNTMFSAVSCKFAFDVLMYVCN